jgi:predicted anti-sigma-YlaC factor YlaD
VRCDRIREAASARLDGEPLGMSAAVLDDHLASCPDCAGWVEDATRLTRQVRLSAVDVPDLAEAITADVVLPTRRVLRAALAVVALVQLAIAIPDLAAAEHLAHEGAAWDIAVAVAFAAAAWAPRRAAGLVPLLATFVLLLAGLSLYDLADGAAATGRELTHLAALVGLVLLVVLDRAERAQPPRRLTVGTSEPRRERRLRGVA